jgi:transcriptional regulator GlxA family with amidase domain
MLVEGSRRTADGQSLPRSVSRALSAMRATPDRPLDLAALAAKSRVSPRTLQRPSEHSLARHRRTFSKTCGSNERVGIYFAHRLMRR